MRHNKTSHPVLFDDTLDWSVDSAPCYRLMGAVFEQAVADYKRLYRQLKKLKQPNYIKLAEMRSLRRFFAMVCEGTRYKAEDLIKQMESDAENGVRHGRGFAKNR